MGAVYVTLSTIGLAYYYYALELETSARGVQVQVKNIYIYIFLRDFGFLQEGYHIAEHLQCPAVCVSPCVPPYKPLRQASRLVYLHRAIFSAAQVNVAPLQPSSSLLSVAAAEDALQWQWAIASPRFANWRQRSLCLSPCPLPLRTTPLYILAPRVAVETRLDRMCRDVRICGAATTAATAGSTEDNSQLLDDLICRGQPRQEDRYLLVSFG